MTFGEWLSSVAEWVSRLWPIQVVNAWEQGARLTLGRLRGGVLRPGWYFVLPLVQTLEIIDASSATFVTDTQTLESADGCVLAVSMIARYRVRDYARLLSTIYEVDDVVPQVVEAATSEWVGSLSYHPTEDQSDMLSELREAVARDVSARLESWGVDLEEVAVHTITPVRVFRVIS